MEKPLPNCDWCGYPTREIGEWYGGIVIVCKVRSCSHEMLVVRSKPTQVSWLEKVKQLALKIQLKRNHK